MALWQLHKPLVIIPAKTLGERLAKLGTESAQYAAEMEEPAYEVSGCYPQKLVFLSLCRSRPADGELVGRRIGSCGRFTTLQTTPCYSAL